MTDEEFDRLKEEEKAHLRQIRALKEAVRLLERQRSVTSALEQMTSRSREALEANERLIDEIARDTARQEAKLDVALESTPDHDSLEETGAAIRAQQLVEKLRRQMSPEEEEATADEAPSVAAEDPKRSPARPEALPEKTLGRMRSEPESGRT